MNRHGLATDGHPALGADLVADVVVSDPELTQPASRDDSTMVGGDGASTGTSFGCGHPTIVR
ncbi:hypothetical protein GCM10009868_06980 [Terrabacter aerolatus]|uniref:Uncharacterized protein n=1 Tax=Terrabacter aerolatus TaxID=422442 RepID=A0A512D6I5_9MICO|nr:hypothetical protein TAE01_39050 [Terrabacter aerolatus]